ncbi:MAG: hypothetical protein ACI8X5_002888 [Planctomycetota bacterium]|jgi:hypothetical protein
MAESCCEYDPEKASSVGSNGKEDTFRWIRKAAEAPKRSRRFLFANLRELAIDYSPQEIPSPPRSGISLVTWLLMKLMRT